MRFFVKAIATGFAMSMGSAIFKKVSNKMGLEKEGNKDDTTTAEKAEAAKAADDAEADDSDADDSDQSH